MPKTGGKPPVSELEIAYSITNKVFANICMFSIIDSLAQEYAIYPTQNVGKVFCDFVLEFQDRFDYLKKWSR